MFCRKCGEQIPDESQFCNKCGTAQKEGEGTEAKAPPLLPKPGPAKKEEDLWKGRFSGKALGHLWFFWILEVIGVAVLYWGVLSPDLRAKAWLPYVMMAVLGIPLLYIVWTYLVRKVTVRYRLTTHRLFKETGFISRKLNEVELVRVDDVSVSQNLVQRIFNVGLVTVISTDATDPRTEIVGIDNPIEVKEIIRKQVRDWRDRALHMETL